MKKLIGIAIVATLFAVPAVARAQKTVSVADVHEAMFTIEAIDHAGRVVTLKNKDGAFEEIYCGPEVTRFDALKVGDKVTFRYHESVVTNIHSPGAAAKAPVTGAVTRNATGVGATIAQQTNVLVTIAAIDEKVPSVTVTTANGHKMSFKADKKNLEGYKVGDKVEITYTEALAITVTPAGK